jgi:hypothetical protein
MISTALTFQIFCYFNGTLERAQVAGRGGMDIEAKLVKETNRRSPKQWAAACGISLRP